jgi:hypothetical protein
VWAIVQFLVDRRPRVKENRGTIGLHWMHEIVVVGCNMHCNVPKRVILNFDTVESELVGIDE